MAQSSSECRSRDAPDRNSTFLDAADVEFEALLEESDEERRVEHPGPSRCMKSAALLLRAGLWIASAVAIVIGVARIVDENNERSSGVRVSRWLLLAGLVFPIWDLCTLWVNLALVVLQKSANTDSVLYVVLPMRHSLINISRWICYLAIWAGLVSGRPHRLDSLYLNVIRILTCIVLLWGARAVGIALTRVIAMQFYDKAYLRRMRDALEREFVIHFLILGARRTGRDKEKEKEKEKGRESEACRKRTGIKNSRNKSTEDLAGAGSTEHGTNALGSRQNSASRPRSRRELPHATEPAAGDAAGAGGTPWSGGTPQEELPRMDPDSPTGADAAELMAKLKEIMRSSKSTGSRPLDSVYLRKFITSQQPQRIFRETVGQISSDSSDEEVKMAARRVTKSLFRSLRRPGQRVLTAGDLERVLTPSIAAKAFEILSLVKGAREISFDTCLAALTDIFNEHRVLERALRDSKTMVGALRRVLIAIFTLIAIGISLGIFSVAVGSLWVSLTSIIIAMSFVFGNTLKDLFETLIKHFSTHPFDVGDIINVRDGPGWARVVEMNLIHTTLVDVTLEPAYWPNSLLFSRPVLNVSRAGRFMDEFWIFVDINTPPEIFSRLEKVLDDLRLANPKHFGDWVAVRAQPSPDNYKIRLAVYYQWAFNRVDLGPTGVARNLLVCKIMETLTAWGVALGANRFVSPPPPAPHMGRLPVPPAPQAPTSPVAEAPGDPLVAHLVAYQPRSEMRPDGTGLPPPGEPWADAPDHGNAVRDRPERAAAAMQIEALQGGGTLPEIPEDKAVVAPAEVAPIETGGGATEEERMMGRLALAHEEEACLKVD